MKKEAEDKLIKHNAYGLFLPLCRVLFWAYVLSVGLRIFLCICCFPGITEPNASMRMPISFVFLHYPSMLIKIDLFMLLITIVGSYFKLLDKRTILLPLFVILGSVAIWQSVGYFLN
ncbi:MAG: hypothetical protein IKS41_06285 [Alphaproteobacteria bacterium]|nr:hypothetical protein [Alphaproteobacteria bacterium]